MRVPTISISVDVEPLVAGLQTLYQDQVPFAASQAINDTAKKIRDGEADALPSRGFILRRPSFIKSGIRVLRWSTKKDTGGPYAIIGIDQDTPAGAILAKFQDGGTRSGASGHVSVPTDAVRPSIQDIANPALRRKALGIGANRKGNQRTFLIESGPGEGLWQRTGKGAIRLLWSWRRSIHVPAMLRFGTTAEPLLATWFKQFFWWRLDEAIKTRKPR